MISLEKLRAAGLMGKYFHVAVRKRHDIPGLPWSLVVRLPAAVVARPFRTFGEAVRAAEGFVKGRAV